MTNRPADQQTNRTKVNHVNTLIDLKTNRLTDEHMNRPSENQKIIQKYKHNIRQTGNQTIRPKSQQTNK